MKHLVMISIVPLMIYSLLRLKIMGKDLFADEFDDLEVAQVDDNLNDEFEGQNQEFGLSEDFTNEPLIKATPPIHN